jgi:hypothetical protein
MIKSNKILMCSAMYSVETGTINFNK